MLVTTVTFPLSMETGIFLLKLDTGRVETPRIVLRLLTQAFSCFGGEIGLFRV